MRNILVLDMWLGKWVDKWLDKMRSNGKDSLSTSKSMHAAGFSMVEVLVVSAIVAAVAFFAIPEFQKSNVRAKALEETEHLRTIEAAKRAFEIAKPGAKLSSSADLLPYLPSGSLPSSVYLEGRPQMGVDIPLATMQGWSTQVLSKIAQANFETYGGLVGSEPSGQSTSYSYEWVNNALEDLGISPLANHYLDPLTGQGYLNVLSLDHSVISTFNGDPTKEPSSSSSSSSSSVNSFSNGFNDLATPGKVFVEPPKPNTNPI